MPYIESITVDNGDSITLFAVNRSPDESCELELKGFENYNLISHTVLTNDDMKLCNSADEPNVISPVQQKNSEDVILAPRSWNMIRFNTK